jgi:hypothetical protein
VTLCASYQISINLANVKEDFIVLPTIRGEYFLNFSQSETRIAQGDHVFCPFERNSYSGPFIDASCKIICSSGFRGDFLEINQPETRIV